MHLRKTQRYGRDGWLLANDRLELFVMAGGGHLAGLDLVGRRTPNPFWIPIWDGVEPAAWRRGDAARYGGKLLACIAGHNLCLGVFGGPSPDEQRAGAFGCHGEAPIVRWKALHRSVGTRRLLFRYGCDLPVARLRFARTLVLERGSSVVRIRETVRNLARMDVPFTMCQHVSFGPPFLEPGVTIFDLSAVRGHTFPGDFGKPQRLRPDTPFTWPMAPGAGGAAVDLRQADRRPHSDFSTLRMDTRMEHAWFSAVNPRAGLLVAYIWKRADFPWLGIWEEHRGRRQPPWNGRSLARGMEFANSPFPASLREAVDRGRFQGERTYRWLPALGRLDFDYALMAAPIEPACRGVAAITPTGRAFDVALRV